jgi:1-deoxy-D-xylulose-5-phosphate synthase
MEVINAKFIKPLDEAMINTILTSNKPVILYEESCKLGGFSSSILEYAVTNKLPTNNIHIMAIEDEFVHHGSKKEILKELNLDVASIITLAKELS